MLNEREVAIEVKASTRAADGALKPLTASGDDGPVRRRIVVCLERQPRGIGDRHDRILLQPIRELLEELWAESVVSFG